MTGPNWHNFRTCARMEIEYEIKRYKKRVLMTRRHYQQDLDAPIKVDTFVSCSVEWLWPNSWNYHVWGDYKTAWENAQSVLQAEFRDYKLVFSDSPSKTFECGDKLYTEKTDVLWIHISNKI